MDKFKKLTQAVYEACELEKCPICLEQLTDTVLLWPCTHRFCKGCVSSLHKTTGGPKVTCPLCKGVTTRRNTLSYQAGQQQYKDCLEQLVSGVSCDLGFDITSYRGQRVGEMVEEVEVSDKNKPHKSSLPLRKSSGRLLRTPSRKSRRIITSASETTRPSDKSTTFKTPVNKISMVSKPETVTFVPETPTDNESKDKKVKEWLEATKFSQAEIDSLTETVVVDIHEATTSPAPSEEQLLSVTQLEEAKARTSLKRKQQNKTHYLPSDFDDIIPFQRSPLAKPNKTRARNKPVGLIDEKFNQLLPQTKKTQFIATTYGSRNPYASTKTTGRTYTVESDIFKSFEESKGQKDMSQTENPFVNSQETLKDFSSGSGEEWNIGKEQVLHSKNINNVFKNKGKSDKCKTKVKNCKTNVMKNKPPGRITRSSLRKNKNENIKNKLTSLFDGNKVENNVEMASKNNCNQSKKLKQASLKTFTEQKKCTEIIKQLTDEWNETKDTLNDIGHSSNHGNQEIINKNDLEKTPKQKALEIIKKVDDDANVSKCIDPKNDEQLPQHENQTVKDDIVKIQNTPIGNRTSSKSLNKHIRSPGWSRLRKTKKEFHMSDKKKLSLKTLPKYSSTPTLTSCKFSPPEKQNKSMDETVKLICDERKSLNVNSKSESPSSVEKGILKLPDNKIESNMSVISSSSSLFHGFSTPQKAKEDNEKLNSDLNKLKKSPLITLNNIVVEEWNIINGNEQQNDNLLIKSTSSLVSENIIQVKENNFEKPNKESTKRKRTSSSDSAPTSPVRKKSYRDVEIQTSPTDTIPTSSSVKAMIQEMWGREAVKLIENAFEKESKILKTQPNTQMEPCKLGKKSDSDELNIQSEKNMLQILSQDSDKENMAVPDVNTNVTETSFNASDFVLGTEDCGGLFLRNNRTVNVKERHFDTQTTKVNSNLEKQELVVLMNIDPNECDPDAATQLYKTPVVPKKVLQASTDIYSAISNPTDSELKKVDTIFDKSNIVLPDETPKTCSPMNCSGIGLLAGNTIELTKHVDLIVKPPSQNLKEKPNRSRRQLDFIEEDSNDMFDTVTNAQRKESSEDRNDEAHSEQIKTPKTDPLTQNNTSMDAVVIADDEKVKSPIEGQVNQGLSEIEKEASQEAPLEEEVIDQEEDQVSNASSDDCIIEATPDVSQADLHEEDTHVVEEPVEKTPETPDMTHEVETDPPQCESEDKSESNHVEQKKNEMSSINNTEGPDEDTNICIATSLLNYMQVNGLKTFFGDNIAFSKTMGPHVSHLIVGTTNKTATTHTYKFLYAMAMHKNVISYEWVKDMWTMGKPLPFKNYFVCEQNGECGVIRAKNDVKRELLKEFAIHIYNVIENMITRDQMEELIRLCGGTVVSELPQFHDVPRDKYRVIIISQQTVDSTQQGWRKKFSAAEVSADWLFRTIGNYRVMPLLSFMMNSTDAMLFLQHEGYREELILDNPSQIEPSC